MREGVPTRGSRADVLEPLVALATTEGVDDLAVLDQEAAEATSATTAAHPEVATLRDLPVGEAAARIDVQREAAEQARLARRVLARKLNGSASSSRPMR